MTKLQIDQALEAAAKMRLQDDLSGALKLYREILSADPDNPQAHCSTGEILSGLKQYKEAIDHYSKALEIHPNWPTFSNLAVALKATGKYQEALNAWKAAIDLDPSQAVVRSNLGSFLRDLGQPEIAVGQLEKAVEIEPENPGYHNRLGLALRDSRRGMLAEKSFREAIRLKPEYPEALTNLASLLRDKFELDEAVTLAKSAVDLRPDSASFRHNYAFALHQRKEWQAALEQWQRAIELKPDHAEAHLGMAGIHLRHGRFESGWMEYEWRWKCRGAFLSSLQEQAAHLLWDGSALEDKTILLHTEQGLGDTLQFARFIPMIAKQAGRVIFACHQKEVRDLIETVEGVDDIIVEGETAPRFDFHCPLMSLPGRLKINSFGEIPGEVPYIKVAPNTVDCVGRELKQIGGNGMKVGINWQGNSMNAHDRARSIPPVDWGQMKSVPNIQWFSLQYGSTPDEIDLPIVDLGARLDDLAKASVCARMNLAAAAIESMDLVITIDTLTAHLAGSLGKRCWVLLADVPCWRWRLDCEDSPWYPTAKLIRQRKAGDWSDVMGKVKQDLTMDCTLYTP